MNKANKAMVKPCNIILKDVYNDVKSRSFPPLRYCFVPLVAISKLVHNVEPCLVETPNNVYFSDNCLGPAEANSGALTNEPLGLQHPRNH